MSSKYLDLCSKEKNFIIFPLSPRQLNVMIVFVRSIKPETYSSWQHVLMDFKSYEVCQLYTKVRGREEQRRDIKVIDSKADIGWEPRAREGSRAGVSGE